MSRMFLAALAFVTALAQTPAAQTPAVARDRAEWAHDFGEEIVALSAEHQSDCFAALTQTELRVWTYDGRLLWRRDLSSLGKWFRAGLVSLAPSCTWAAVGGTSSYRYVWIVTRDGRSRHIPFGGETPMALAIAPGGDRLAVATASSRLHLFDGLPVRPVRAIPKTRNPMPRTLVFTSDGRQLLSTEGYACAMLTRDGGTIWKEDGGWCTMSPAGSADWFLSINVPTHGPGDAWISAIANDGTRLWKKYLPASSAVRGKLAPHASLLAEGRLLIVTRAGDVTVNVPVQARAIAGVSDDGGITLLKDNDDTHLWLRWVSSTGRELASEEITRSFWTVDARRGLTRLILHAQGVLRVLARPLPPR